MLHASRLPKNLWGEAINHAVWLKNRASMQVLGKVTLYEHLYGEKPNLGGVPKWGQCVWAHNDTGSKLNTRANEARWIGFNSGSPHAHCVYWMGKNSISVKQNIKFVPITVTVFTPPPSYDASTTPAATQPTVPTIPPTTPSATMPPRMAPITITPQPTFTQQAQVGTQTPPLSSVLPPTTAPKPILQPASDKDIADDEKEEEAEMPSHMPQAPRKKKNKTGKPSQPMHKSEHIPKLSDYMKRLQAGEGTTREEYNMVDSGFSVELKGIIAVAIHKADCDPKSLSEAQAQSDWPLWKAAMDCELNTLEQAGTWETVLQPPNTNVVGSK
jgi:hypothetical protein